MHFQHFKIHIQNLNFIKKLLNCSTIDTVLPKLKQFCGYMFYLSRKVNLFLYSMKTYRLNQHKNGKCFKIELLIQYSNMFKAFNCFPDMYSCF